MPLIPQDDNSLLNAPMDIGQNPENVQTTVKPSFFETLGAGFRLQNEVGSLLTRDPKASWAGQPINPNYDPFSAIPADKRAYAARYIEANSPEEVDGVTRQIEQEEQDRKTLQEGGLLGTVSAMGAGLLSPMMLIPIGGEAWETYRAGGNLLKGALLSASHAAGAISLQEAALHATQVTRTGEESAYNIAGAAFLGGIFGGIGTGWSNAVLRSRAKTLAELADLTEKDLNVPKVGRYTPDEVAQALHAYDQTNLTLSNLDKRVVPEGQPAPENPAPYQMTQEQFRQQFGDLRNRADLNAQLQGVLDFKGIPQQAGEPKEAYFNRVVRHYETKWDLPENSLQVEFKPAAKNSAVKGSTFMSYKNGQVNIGKMVFNEKSDLVTLRHELEHVRDALKSDYITRFPMSTGTDATDALTGKFGFPSEMLGEQHHKFYDRFDTDYIHRQLVKQALAEGKTVPDNVLQQYPELGVRKSSPDYINAVLAHEDAKARWEEMVQHIHEIDPMEPGFSKISPEEVQADTNGWQNVYRSQTRRKMMMDAGFSEAEINNESPEAPDGEAGPAIPQTDEKLKDSELLSKLPVMNQQDPLIRTTLSQSLETRKTVQKLAEVPLRYEKNALGIATELPAEALIKQHKGPLAFALKHLDDMFVKYRLGRAGSGLDKMKIDAMDLVGATPENKLTWEAFKDEVGKAMRNGDTHEIPEVASAAKRFREDVFDPLKEKAVDLKLLPENVTPETAMSYLTRVYDIQKIIAQRDQFFQLNLDWLRQKEMLKPPEQQRTTAQLEDVADQIVDRILGTPEGRLPYNLLDGIEENPGSLGQSGGNRGLSKPLRLRLYDIPDQKIEPFLSSDIEHIAKLYERSMGPDLALMEKFGSVDLTKELEAIRKDYANKLRQVETDAERIKLKKAMDSDIRDIAAIRDRLRHTHGLPADPNSPFVRAGRVLRALNFMSLMGGVTISSIADLARPMMVHGLRRYLEDGLVPLVKDFQHFRAAADEVKLGGSALDMMLESRVMNLSEMMDDFGRGTKAEKLLMGMTHNYGRLTGIAQWTAFGKQFAGMMTMSRVIDAALESKAASVAPKEVANLAASYIDPAMARRIADQFEAHGETQGSVRLPNTANWTDREAARIFRAAVNRDVDRIIVTPGQDKPLWISGEWGKLLGQFRSFFIASTQRVLMSGLQERDLGVLNGTVFAVGLGVITALLQNKLSGRNISKRPVDLILEGVDRAGIAGWLFDANNMVEKLTRGHLGLSAMTGKQPMSRYASRNIVDALVGPTAGRLDDIAKISGAAASNDWHPADVRAVRRLLPYQNLFYLRWLFDKAEQGLLEHLGIPNNDEAKTE